MRNEKIATRSRIFLYAGVVTLVTTSLVMVGCAPKSKSGSSKVPTVAPQVLVDAGFAALEAKEYNQALADADKVIASGQHGPATAEALYLKGRALEGKNSTGELKAAEVTQNLAAARAAYMQALDTVPKQPLDSYIRTSLANVAYFQDDYSTAISQWAAAYDKLDRDDVKAWALYRIGVSQQRIGQYDQADKTFGNVQTTFPNTVPAQRAREHQGARAFYVQLATFSTGQAADTAVASLKQQGVPAARADNGNTSIVRIGPVSSYSQATYFKQRFADKYPDAIILP